ncbi:MAG: hypothetical protein LUE13_10910 [Akkermansiaceae bacterium]|nr:hypothetical protein [Akkermansiaceae bacterium]
MQVATSRLDIVNETDAFTQKVQHQADHLRQLKKRAMSIPVIGSIVGTVGGILLIKTLTGKKNRQAPARPRLSGRLVNSSLFRFIIEILITLAFPSLKKLGFDLANKKFLSLFKFRSH